MRRILLIAVLAAAPAALSAARLTLRDGSVIDGRMISASTASIVFQDDTGRRRVYDLGQVSNIDFNYAPGYNQQPYPQGADRYDARHDMFWATLPAGTEVAVRTDEDINRNNMTDGHTYRASIRHDLVDENGRVAVPGGSNAWLIARREPNGDFILDLDSVEVQGHRYAVASSDVEARQREGLGANGRTAKMVGGGAVLGTLLGAIAGGGKGAAIGAAAGAATGGGVEVLTRGPELRVPAETVLRFRLERPLHLRER